MNKERMKQQDDTPLYGKLFHAAGQMQTRLEADLSGIGLSLSKYTVLNQLSKAGKPLPLTVLADKCSCVKSNITQLIDGLEADGLVERVDDPDDRRSKLAVMKDEGRRRHKLAAQAVAEAEKQVFGEFKLEEVELLNDLLDRLGGA